MEEKISLETLKKAGLRVGEITAVDDHPEADRLLVLTVDLGEETTRTIVAGLKEQYEKEDLTGKKAIFVTNLEPATLRGVESNGMILAAVTEGKSDAAFITPEHDIPVGTRVS